jgi:hypothetical protein
MTLDDYTKRDVAVITAGSIIATVLIAVIIRFLIGFVAADPCDPLTKAGGLKPTQDIRK